MRRLLGVISLLLSCAAVGKAQAPLRTFELGSQQFGRLAISPDNKTVVCLSYKSLSLWDFETGEKLKFPGKEKHSLGKLGGVGVSGEFNSYDVKFSPDGKLLAISESGVTVRLYDVASGKRLSDSMTAPGHTSRSHFFPDNRRLIADGTHGIKCWDFTPDAGPKLLYQIKAPTFLGGTELSRDGQWLIYVTGKEHEKNFYLPTELVIADAQTGATKKTIPIGKDEKFTTVPGCRFTVDGKHLIIGSKRFVVHEWENGKDLASFYGPGYPAAISPDGELAAFVMGKTEIGIPSVSFVDLKRKVRLGYFAEDVATAHNALFSQDGKYFVTLDLATSKRAKLRIWETSRLLEDLAREQARQPKLIREENQENLRAISAGGRYFASFNAKQRQEVVDADTGKQLGSLEPAKDEENIRAISPDGSRYLTTKSYSYRMLLRETASGKELRTIDAGRTVDYNVTSVTFRPDGKEIATLSDNGRVATWDVDTGKQVQTIKEFDHRRMIAYAPDGKTLGVVTRDGRFRLWNPESNKILRSQAPHGSAITCLAFSPNGKILATASDDKSVKLWDTDTGKELAKLVGHAAYVNWISFSPDGKWMATASNDRTIRLWTFSEKRANLAELHSVLLEHTSEVWLVSFTPDSRRLISSGDGVKYWALPSNGDFK